MTGPERTASAAEVLGLEGPWPSDAKPPPMQAVVEPREPFELLAWQAGLKPLVFLTVRGGEADAVAALFAGAHVERRERRVEIGPQDRWNDDRSRGEPRVELYISRDEGLARRGAALSEEDPSANAAQLGALLGYPECCVRAFQAQEDRSNNTLNRYLCAERTPPATAWRPLLNDLHTKVNPFFACSYACDAANEQAEATLSVLAERDPRTADALRRSLSRPVLYFDHDHQLILDGSCDGDAVRYSAVEMARCGEPASGFDALAGAVAAGDTLRLSSARLEVERDGELLHGWDRVEPHLGFIAPFRAGRRGTDV